MAGFAGNPLSAPPTAGAVASRPVAGRHQFGSFASQDAAAALRPFVHICDHSQIGVGEVAESDAAAGASLHQVNAEDAAISERCLPTFPSRHVSYVTLDLVLACQHAGTAKDDFVCARSNCRFGLGLKPTSGTFSGSHGEHNNARPY